MSETTDTISADQASAPILTIDGPRATIRLNRPKHLNRLQASDLDTLLELFDRVEADPAVRVLVLTGTGRAFSAGFDLGAVADRATSEATQSSAGSSFEIVANRLEDIALPTICRLNGGVYGGSTDLALACDFRIGVDTCEMFMPAARLGLHYYKGGIKRYVTRLGVDNAKRLFLTAQKLEATEMLRIGYLTATAPEEALDEEVDKLATILAGNAPSAMRGMKRPSTNSPAANLTRTPPTNAPATACAAPRSRKGLRRFRRKGRRGFRLSQSRSPD
ncbi:MAG: 3-hydroxybutyryl-CoA dehydratase, partial [Tardiphaga sp.]|nr:3-hydroxybutyryl-CoA dehydratase [Tardiphaga sp.]